MNTNGHHTKQADGRPTRDDPNVAASFSGLAHDSIELAELQAQLLVLDVKSAAFETRTSLVLVVVAATLLLGCIPVALLALGEVFVEQFEWSRSAALAVSAVIGLVLCGACVAVAWARFKVGLESLNRSREELKRNLSWIKSNLKRARPHSSPPPR